MQTELFFYFYVKSIQTFSIQKLITISIGHTNAPSMHIKTLVH